MSCGIYKIENLINHKIYIGQSINIEQRFYKHRSTKDDLLIHKAIQKYGKDNFTYEIIEECSPEELNDREIYWINFFDCCILNGKNKGYNLNYGGSNGAGFAKGKEIEQYSLDGVYLNTFPSANQAANVLNISSSNIITCANEKSNQAGPYQWKWKDSNKIIKPIKGRVFDKVLQYDLQGNLLEEFESLTDVTNKLGFDKASISIACNTDNSSSHGFQWKYKHSLKQIQILKPKIIQYDKNLNKINEYDTISEAYKATGIHRGNITECCNGKRKSAGGFIWKKEI